MPEPDIQGTPLVPADMVEPDPAAMTLPTNADLLAEEQENADDKKEEGAASGDDAGETPGEADASGTPDPPPAQEAQVQYEEVADPGTFTPGDYSFEVQVFDGEGKQLLKTIKVTSLEQWDEVIAELDSNGQSFGPTIAAVRAQRAAERMDRGIEQDKAKYENAKAEYDKAVEDQAGRDRWTGQAAAELDYLVAKNELPPMPKEFHVSTANWKDPKVASQPAVKAQMELLKYFRTENATRAKAGLAPMTSLLDAWNGYAREQEKAATKDNKTANIAARRDAGSKVASTSPRPATAAPKGIAVGRTGLLD